jgi:iron complex outermembrane receptor protein
MSFMSNKRGFGKLSGTVSGLALLLATGGAAFAQEAGTETPSTEKLEIIKVTAQYISQDIQKTPLAITAITNQDLENRGITDLSQLTTQIPSLNLTKEPNAFGSGVRTYIRGIGQYDTAFAAEPGVGMYIDDVYYGTLFGTVFDLLDLQRVEVLKGPQGVLGGKNNIGGAIRMISIKPSDDNAGYAEVGYGAYDEVFAKGAMDLTIVPSHLFIRVSAMSKVQSGYVNMIDYACKYGPGTAASGPGSAGSLPVITQRPDCTIGKQGGTNVQGARFALRWVVLPGLEDNFEVDGLRDNSEQAPDVLYAADPGDGNVYFNRGKGIQTLTRAQFFGVNSDGVVNSTSGIPGWNAAVNIPKYGIPWDQRFIPAGGDIFKTTYTTNTSQAGLRYTDGGLVHSWGLTNLIDWDALDRVHVKLITGYRWYRSASGNDSDVSPMSYQLTTSFPDNREFQQEVRFTGALFDDHLEWTAGVFYYNRTNHQHGPVTLDANYSTGATFLVFEQNDKYVTENKSAYVHFIYHLTDDLEFFGGARYTKENKTYFFDHSGVVPGYPLGGFFRATIDPTLDCNIFAGHLCNHSISPALTPHTSHTNRPDWRGGLDYSFSKEIMAYFQFSTGYRTGGTNSRPFAPDQLDSYGAETLKSYEVGLKSDWFDNRLRVNASFYLADYTNIITPLAQTDFSLGFPLPYVHYVNLGTAKDKGFEIEATLIPIDGLVIDANVSFTHLRSGPLPGAPAGYLDGCSAAGMAAGLCPQVAAGTVRIGTNPILFPESTFHLGAQYTFETDSAGKFTPRLDYNWQDVVYQDANNNPNTALPARGLLDARFTWDAPAGGWSTALEVQNVLDKHYFLDLFNLAIFGQGTIEGQPGQPRTWLVTVRKNF